MKVKVPLNEQQVFEKYFPNGIGMFAFLSTNFFIDRHGLRDPEKHGKLFPPKEHIDTIRPEGKYEGEFYGVPIYSSGDIPEGKMYFYDQSKLRWDKAKFYDEPKPVFMSKEELSCLRQRYLLAIVSAVLVASWIWMIFFR